MKIANLHSWTVSIARAKALQIELRERLEFPALPLRAVRTVAGADIAVGRDGAQLVAAVVVVDFPSLEVIETRVVRKRFTFPYVPGYLSFREVPALIACLRRVRTPIDALLCDGQGIAHPRGFGLACHVGLWTGIPTVGSAKSRLVGEHGPVGERRGDFANLYVGSERIGAVLRTRDGIRPLFVSPGNLIDVISSRRLVLACCTRYRLPEPQRLAHIAAGEAKRGGA
ncbi:MAG TPA: endonuclease V [Candidatus Krumholzibacteria bacterium]|nr:endonuclease V [Candidatus Krumholzibacteria bacterium]